MGRAVHQLVHTLSYGDAISTEVLALQSALSSSGTESRIYSINTHPRHKGETVDYREFDRAFEGEVILHYSLGSPLNPLYTSLNRCKRTLIYHNITPARWFAPVNHRVAADIEAGLDELPALCRCSDRLLADSAFNAAELAQLGFAAEELALPVYSGRWDEPRNEGIFRLAKEEGGIQLLHVGRLAPNKCVEDIIKIFYYLHHHIDKHSRLWLVGIDTDTELYSFSLKRLAHELHVADAITFAGCLADSEVRALYEACSSYVCMSEHEGFCLPVIEAMHFGLPVLAFASSAVPETLGAGGVLVREKRHPEIAELLYRMHNDPELRAKIVSAGRAQVGRFSMQRFKERVAGLFGESGSCVGKAAGNSSDRNPI